MISSVELARRSRASHWLRVELLSPSSHAAAQKLAVAAIVTQYSYRSHARHPRSSPYLFPFIPAWIATCVDQVPANEFSRRFRQVPNSDLQGVPRRCSGGVRLAVDAVLSIGEHGKYPVNARAQMEYPRKRFFDEIVAVFRRSKRMAPVFSDKHLSYRWDWAKEMYDTSRRMKIPLMAGSSVPLAERTPPLELPPRARIEEAVSIHGGGVESYDIHGLEVLQAMVEARRGGETGVAKVQFVEGEALWQAAKERRWSPELSGRVGENRFPVPSAQN